jgi:hypothetical protein
MPLPNEIHYADTRADLIDRASRAAGTGRSADDIRRHGAGRPAAALPIGRRVSPAHHRAGIVRRSPQVTPTSPAMTPAASTASSGNRRFRPVTRGSTDNTMVAAGQDAGAGLRRRFWLQGKPDQCRYSPMGPVPGSLMASGWGSPVRAARAVAAPVLPFRVAVITCWRLRAKCRRRMSFQAGPRRCCRPRRWRRSAGSARAGPFAPELRCPRACGSPAAPSADVVHRWCDARTDHDYRVPKRAIKIRNQASCTRRRRRQGEAGPANLLRSLLSYLRVSAIEPEPARSFRG